MIALRETIICKREREREIERERDTEGGRERERERFQPKIDTGLDIFCFLWMGCGLVGLINFEFVMFR